MYLAKTTNLASYFYPGNKIKFLAHIDMDTNM